MRVFSGSICSSEKLWKLCLETLWRVKSGKGLGGCMPCVTECIGEKVDKEGTAKWLI